METEDEEQQREHLVEEKASSLTAAAAWKELPTDHGDQVMRLLLSECGSLDQ